MQVSEMLEEFHSTFGLTINTKPQLVDEKLGLLRQSLIDEENDELAIAVERDDLVEIADALADIVYVAYGTALVYGIPLDTILEEVHRTNMDKLENGKVLRRSDGKVLKRKGWAAPDIESILKDASE